MKGKKYEFTYLKSGRSVALSIVTSVVGVFVLLGIFLLVPSQGLAAVSEDVFFILLTIAGIAVMVLIMYLVPSKYLNKQGFGIINGNNVEIHIKNHKHVLYYGDIVKIALDDYRRHGNVWVIADKYGKEIRIPEPHESLGEKNGAENLKEFIAALKIKVQEYRAANPDSAPKEKPKSLVSKIAVAVIMLLVSAMMLYFGARIVDIFYIRATGETVTGQITGFSAGRTRSIIVRYEAGDRVFTETLFFESTLGLRQGNSIQLFYLPSNPRRVTAGRPDMLIAGAVIIWLMLVVGIVFTKMKGG